MHPCAVIEKWYEEPPCREAKYRDGHETGAISFNGNAAVIETELVIKKAELPNRATIADFIKTYYKGEKMQRCENVTMTEIQITGKEIIFDHQGNFIIENLTN